jgi:structural maintenance of chromosome 2
VDKKYEELLKNKDKVENDKMDITKNIEELDKKRKITVEKCFLSVSESFRKIFSELLPGAYADLKPTTGHVLDGLEIEVRFG